MPRCWSSNAATPRDMNGHYPHNCYTNSGEQEISGHSARTVTIEKSSPPLTFTLTEYQFQQIDGRKNRRGRRCTIF